MRKPRQIGFEVEGQRAALILTGLTLLDKTNGEAVISLKKGCICVTD